MGKASMARQPTGSNVWHYCWNCDGWPESEYIEGDGETGGEKCAVCLRKIRTGNCYGGR